MRAALVELVCALCVLAFCVVPPIAILLIGTSRTAGGVA
jgi:hypothetical protein